MCIIAYYRKNLPLNKEELETCFENNPDGAGLMYQENKTVHIMKGFMDWDKFWEVAEKLPTNVDRVFHFRIATSGKVSPGICHPFPICNDYKRMKLIDSYTNMGLAHNGVMYNYTPTKGIKDDKSDTMVFTKEIVYELDEGRLIKNPAIRQLIDESQSSRFAIMDSEETYLIGDFEQSDTSKAIYSNSAYKESKIVAYCGYGNYYGGYYKNSYWEKYIEKEKQKEKKGKEKESWEEWDYDGYIRFKDRNFNKDEIENIMCEFENNYDIYVGTYSRDSHDNEIYLYFSGTMPSGNGSLGYLDIEFKCECFASDYGDSGYSG